MRAHAAGKRLSNLTRPRKATPWTRGRATVPSRVFALCFDCLSICRWSNRPTSRRSLNNWTWRRPWLWFPRATARAPMRSCVHLPFSSLRTSAPIVSRGTWPRQRDAAHVLEFFEIFVWNSILMSWTICGGSRIDCGPAPPRRDGWSSVTSISDRRGLTGSATSGNFPACRAVLRNRSHRSAPPPSTEHRAIGAGARWERQSDDLIAPESVDLSGGVAELLKNRLGVLSQGWNRIEARRTIGQP